VERAQALETAPAGGLEGDVVADDLVDAGALTDKSDVLVPDAACHPLILRTRIRPRSAYQQAGQRPGVCR
jgi:hypothetical protein